MLLPNASHVAADPNARGPCQGPPCPEHLSARRVLFGRPRQTYEPDC